MILHNLLFASLLVVVTFLVHFIGLVVLSAMLRRRGIHPVNLSTIAGQGASILTIVLALFALHSIEIWIYALAYVGIDAFASMEAALYYSISSFTTVGFGDLQPEGHWRLLGAAEAMNGFLLIGWSTAFLVSVSARVRAFEASIERLDDD